MSDHSGSTDTTPDGTWHVTIPDRVGDEIEQRITGTDFDSVNEYVTFALESLLRELDEQENEQEDEHENEQEDEQEDRDPEYQTDRDIDSEDVDAIQDNLESLGYL